MNPPKSIYDFLAKGDPVTSCELAVALAGRPQRKSFALALFRESKARRIILSTGRYEVRQTAAMVPEIARELLAARDATLAADRHFWIDISREQTTVSHANLARVGTFEELQALAGYLKVQPPRTLGLVSTSVHLRRVRFCCSRINLFQQINVLFWPVPESEDLPLPVGWWKRPADCGYICSELVKLAGYHLVYG